MGSKRRTLDKAAARFVVDWTSDFPPRLWHFVPSQIPGGLPTSQKFGLTGTPRSAIARTVSARHAPNSRGSLRKETPDVATICPLGCPMLVRCSEEPHAPKRRTGHALSPAQRSKSTEVFLVALPQAVSVSGFVSPCDDALSSYMAASSLVPLFTMIVLK